MDKETVLYEIGNEICEGCGPDRDCGLELEDCSRFISAANTLDQWVGFLLVDRQDNLYCFGCVSLIKQFLGDGSMQYGCHLKPGLVLAIDSAFDDDKPKRCAKYGVYVEED